MKSEKKYYSIREVSQMLNIKPHVIRHWDSIDPKTKKIRIENLSIRTNGGTRYFNKSHITKLINLQNILKENGKRNYSLNLASKIILQNKHIEKKFTNFDLKSKISDSKITEEIRPKIILITNKLRNLLKK